MSSEIEVVESRNHEPASAAGESEAVGANKESRRSDVYTAAAHGDMEKVLRLVESEGCSVSEPDGLGHFALQWAALNNHTAAAQFIIEHGGNVNAEDDSGQTALHWSAVRGSIQVAELLLQEGARITAADMYGYQSTHVAAQYGQTAFLYHIVSKWNADPDVPDKDGRSPIHWAAYKGFADCIRLLLFLDAYRVRQDKEGCTPLHWAAIRGNLEACTVLVQAGKKEDLMVSDSTGLTPAQLASDKNHRQVAFFLGNAKRLLDKRCDGNSFFGKFSKLGLGLILWCIIFVLLVTYTHSVIMAPDLLKLTASFALFAWFGVFQVTVGLVMLYRCSSKDPGFIGLNGQDTQSMKDDEPLLKMEIYNPALQAGNWSQLCATCKIVRPHRAKHCSTCDRCVEQFDHHCPWISNCIGKKNKWDFLVFLLLEVSAMLVTGSVALTRLLTDPFAPSYFGGWLRHASSHHTGAVSFLVVDFFLFFGVAGLTFVQASQISRNITTNEMANAMRYSYLRGPSGRFRNPYDHGLKKNCWDFLISGHNEDLERVGESEGIGMVNLGKSSSLQNGGSHSHRANGNGHVAVNISHHGHGHVHSSHCSRSGESSTDLGLGHGRTSVVAS